MQKSVIILLASSDDTLPGFSVPLGSGSKMAFLVFCSLLWLLSSFYHRLCFSLLPFLLPLLGLRQLPLAVFSKPATVDDSFYALSETVCSVWWPLVQISVANTFSFPFVTHFLTGALNLLFKHKAIFNAITLLLCYQWCQQCYLASDKC